MPPVGETALGGKCIQKTGFVFSVDQSSSGPKADAWLLSVRHNGGVPVEWEILE